MRKFLNAIIFIPLGLIFVVFAVANRHAVTVSFDPFDSRDPAMGVTLPLFVVLIAVAIFGVVAGGAATWIAQRHRRGTARRDKAEAAQTRMELADLKANSMRPNPRVPALPRPHESFDALQDKPRLTL